MQLKKFLSFSILFCFVFSTYAQDKTELLLKEILSNLSIQHNVTFNYIDEEITLYKIVPPKSTLSLENKLEYITLKTNLEFKFISANYISIINNQNLDHALCGYILDFETKEPIADATLKATDLPYYTTTNEKGYFEFSQKEIFNIEVSHLGYTKIEFSSIDLNKVSCPTFYLKTTINELEPIVAEVYLTKGIIKKKEGYIEISPKKIGLLPGLVEPDVFLTLQQAPGINNQDENIHNTSVRGGTHDQNLMEWNGIKLFHTAHFFGLISALNPNLAHNIKLYKNGTPANYGNGVSSSIIISTHADSIESTKASVGINFLNADFYSKFKIAEKATLEISGRRAYTDFISMPTYSNYLNKIFQNTAVLNTNNNEGINYSTNENFYFYDFSAQYHQQIKDKSNLYIDVIGINNFLELNQTTIENGTEIVKNSDLEQQTFGASATFNHNWNSKNFSSLKLNGSFYKIDSKNESITNNQIFNQENSILDTGFELFHQLKLNHNFKFHFGYSFNEIGVRNVDQVNSPLFSRKIKNILISHAAFAELNYNSKNNKLKGRIGFRDTYIQELQTNLIEPRLQLNYKLFQPFEIEVQAEQKNQTFSQIVDLQQDFLGIEKRRWTLSNNENIPILKSNQVSLGFNFSKKNWLISLDNFYKKVEGITSMSQGFQNQFEFQKTNGNYEVYGTEFLVQKRWKNITAWTNYTFMNNNYLFTEFVPSEFPNNFEINHSVKAAVLYNYKNLKLSIGSTWFTGKPTTLSKSTTPIYNSPEIPEVDYDKPNASNLEDYFQMNFSSSYSFNLSQKSKLNLGLSIQNLLDNRIVINQNYRVNFNTNSVEEINTYSLERTFNAFIRFSL